MRTLHRILSVITLLALMSGPALIAQEDREYDPDRDGGGTVQSDPPARAARLQYMNGSVSVQPHGTDDWVAGELNRPLTNSDNIWADKNSRAEISVGTGLIRIDSESSLTLTNVSENMVQLQLHQGAMYLHVRRLYDNETFEVDTANQAFTVLKPGDYRFDVDPDNDKTIVTVWRGEGESTGSGPTVRVRANQQARFSNGTSLTNDIHEAPSPDAFDEWAQSRDGRLDHSASSRYVSPGVVGYEDLDEYGTWRETGDYGEVWVPRSVPVGWAPYTYGHWIWDDPWGWTWVDYDPWGYAPFHYGRWVYASGYWGWAPGPIWVRPYYAPALVAWFGGPGWGASFGYGFGYGGGVGWCPLGFGEPFIPWYGASRGYFTNVNVTNIHVTNVTNITNIYNNNFVNGHPKQADPHGAQFRYANMHTPNGFTAVSRNTLERSLPVARNNVRISPNELSRVTPVHTVDAKPTRATMLGSNAGKSGAAPPARSFGRPVVSRVAPPASGRGAFHSDSPVASLGRNAGRPSLQTGIAPGNNVRGIQQPGSIPNRNAGPTNVGPNSNARMPDNRPMASRSVPRPPSAGGFDNRGGITPQAGDGPRSNVSRAIGNSEVSRPGGRSAPEVSARGNVPRPASTSMDSGGGRGPSPSYSPRTVERPSAPRESAPPQRQSAPPRSNERQGPPRAEMSVPRPSASTSPRGYSSAGDRGSFPSANNRPYQAPHPSSTYEANTRPVPGYGGGSNNRPAPNYGGGSYNRPAPSYDSGSSGRPAPSYGGGSYQRPAPSYGGGGSYQRSMPSYGGGGRAPSYGGGGFGGGGRAPSSGGFGGGGRAPSSGGFGGGGRAPSSGSFGGGGGRSSGGFGGGGGSASAPSHSSGGGGGGSHSSGSHGGRH